MKISTALNQFSEKAIGGKISLFIRIKIISYILNFIFLIVSFFAIFFFYQLSTSIKIKELNNVKDNFYQFLSQNIDEGKCLDSILSKISEFRGQIVEIHDVNDCINPYSDSIFIDEMSSENDNLFFSLIFELKNENNKEVNNYIFFERKFFKEIGINYEIKSDSEIIAITGDNEVFSVYVKSSHGDMLYENRYYFAGLIIIASIYVLLIILLNMMNLRSAKQLNIMSDTIIEKIKLISIKKINIESNPEEKFKNNDIKNIKKSFDFLFYLVKKNEKEMREIIERKSNYNQILGHEILSPLQSLKFILSENEDGLRKINRIVSSVKNIESIRSQEETFSIGSIESVNIIKFLESYFYNQKNMINNISINYPKNIDYIVDTDIEALEQIIDHIINNANAYRDHNTAIFLNLSENDDFFIIDIENKGSPIPCENLGKIFNLGFSSKKNGENIGQGLYVAKMLISKLGGEIKAINTNYGVIFKIKILKI